MTITPEIKNQLTDIVRQAMDQQEERKAAAKAVYRRICADFERELCSFNYSKPKEYIDSKGVKQKYNAEVSCWWKVQQAIGTLLRSAYQVNFITQLPPEKETEMRQFVRSVLSLMHELKKGDD